jgi:hypothetical protein
MGSNTDVYPSVHKHIYFCIHIDPLLYSHGYQCSVCMKLVTIYVFHLELLFIKQVHIKHCTLSNLIQQISQKYASKVKRKSAKFALN